MSHRYQGGRPGKSGCPILTMKVGAGKWASHAWMLSCRLAWITKRRHQLPNPGRRAWDRPNLFSPARFRTEFSTRSNVMEVASVLVHERAAFTHWLRVRRLLSAWGDHAARPATLVASRRLARMLLSQRLTRWQDYFLTFEALRDPPVRKWTSGNGLSASQPTGRTP